jgi:hypothetical protein
MAWYQTVIDEMLEERVVSSRGRRVPRGVRQRISQYRTRKRGSTNLIKGINYREAVAVVCT